MSVQDSESRRFEQTFGRVFLRPILAQDRPRKYFFGVFEKFETFFSKICAHSERYRNLLAGIFEILTFYGNIAFPLSPVFGRLFCEIYLGSKMGHFHERPKNRIFRNPKRSDFITYIFQLLFDTATLVIMKLRMMKATGCKQRCKSDLLYRILYAYTTI